MLLCFSFYLTLSSYKKGSMPELSQSKLDNDIHVNEGVWGDHTVLL